MKEMLGLSSFKIRPRRVHVIGAGLSGLSCAVKLKEAGIDVRLYEATAQAGGRCRSYEDKHLGRTIDNGNHLILRSNKATFEYIKQLRTFGEFYGLTKDYVFHDTEHKKQWYVSPPMVKGGWRSLSLLIADSNKTVTQCFNKNSVFYREFIEPLCIAALNTQPSEASAEILRNVWLRMLIPSMADYLQVRTNLSDALITPALSIIDNIQFSQRLNGIEIADKRVTALQFTDKTLKIREDERIVLATPADVTAKLLPSIKLPEFEYNAIINGHFLCDTDNLSPRLLGVTNSPLHWVFLKDGLISTTTSHAELSALYNKDNIAEILWQEVGKCYSSLANIPMPEHRIITEKRATIAATPNNINKRPKADTGINNITLAGDWLASPLPACIESSIQSGNKAASWCLKQPTQ